MNPKPVILARTTYDFDTLITMAKQALGYGINKTIDEKRLQKETQKFYAALSELHNEDYGHTSAMEGLILDFYSYTLGLVIEDHLYVDLLHHRSLTLLKNFEFGSIKRGYTFCVITGTLRDWRDAVIDGSTKESTHEMRELMNSVYSLFANEGLLPLWSNYSKLNFDDTIVLIPQK